MTAETTFIYGLVCPTSGEIRYVGKADNPNRRLVYHISAAKRQTEDNYKARWLRKLLHQELRPELTILEECPTADWPEREIYWISQFENLTNTAEGGKGGRVFTDEQREELSLQFKEKWQDPDYRKYTTDAIRNAWQSPELRSEHSELSKEMWKNSEYRKAISQNSQKMWQNPEYRKVISQNSQKNWKNPEYRARITEAVTERMNRPEVKEKFRQINSDRIRTPEEAAKRVATRRANDSCSHTEETKERLSEIQRQRYVDNPELREISRENIKASHTEEANAKRRDTWAARRGGISKEEVKRQRQRKRRAETRALTLAAALLSDHN